MSEDTPPYSGPQRVFSGVQPSGNLHLGNYLGAIKKFVDLQTQMDCIYCVVDLHAITQPISVWGGPEALAEGTREIAAAFIASGIDPEQAIVFAQSSVPAHAELGWYFNCVARMGWLERMTQFKDKAGKDRERASMGPFDYPVLQDADILIYKATHVPVGEDQKQHLELCRDIATKFNNDFGVEDFFPITEPVIGGPAPRVMSLRDGTKKMSKSDPSDMSRINLTDDADAIASKIRKARTDPEPLPETLDGLAERPEARNLVGIYAALSDQTADQVVAAFAGQGFGAFKPALADLAVAKLGPIADEMNRLMADPAEIDRILGDGANRAAAIAEPVLAETYKTVGFIRSR